MPQTTLCFALTKGELHIAQLKNLGISVDIGEQRVQRIRERYPDLNITVELDLARVSTVLAHCDAVVGRGGHVNMLTGS